MLQVLLAPEILPELPLLVALAQLCALQDSLSPTKDASHEPCRAFTATNSASLLLLLLCYVSRSYQASVVTVNCGNYKYESSVKLIYEARMGKTKKLKLLCYNRKSRYLLRCVTSFLCISRLSTMSTRYSFPFFQVKVKIYRSQQSVFCLNRELEK